MRYVVNPLALLLVISAEGETASEEQKDGGLNLYQSSLTLHSLPWCRVCIKLINQRDVIVSRRSSTSMPLSPTLSSWLM